MGALKAIYRLLNYYFPREVLGPFAMVFCAENIMSILFHRYIPKYEYLWGWVSLFILFTVFNWAMGRRSHRHKRVKDKVKEDMKK